MDSSMKFFFSALMLSMCVACAPSKYTMHLETRYPSKSGLDLAGKNVSVIYLENGTEFKDGFSASMAESLAYYLEQDYGTGEGSVGVFRMSKIPGANYASKDTLVNLLMDTGSDLVFLIDTVRFGEMTVGGPSKVAYAATPDSSTVNVGSIPFNLRLYSYDAMNESEEVRNFGGTAIAQPDVYSNGSLSSDQLKSEAYKALPAEGWAAGELLSKSFASQWKVEGYSIIYIDSPKWLSAAEKADQLDWKGAMDIWFGLLDSKDVLKRASAAYNIALSCYMLGDYKLAEEWLDLSDKDSELPLSSSLRTRIEERK